MAVNTDQFTEQQAVPMSQTTIQPLVKSGIPWWLWCMMLVLGGGVLAAVVVSLIPVNAEQEYQNALAAFQEGDRDGVQKAISVLQGRPEYAARLQLLEGLQLMANSRPLKAVPLLREASKNDELKITALSYLAQALSRSAQRLEAVEVLREAIGEENVDDSQVHGVLGGVLYELGAYEESLAQLALMQNAPVRERANAFRLRGEMLSDLGKHAEAVAEYEAALKANPTSPQNAQITRQLVKSLVAAGEYEKAMEPLEAVEPSPEKESIKAEILLKTGKVDEAARTIEAATAASSGPDEMPATGEMGRIEALVAAAQGKEKAEQVLIRLREFIPRFSRNADYYEAMADLARAAGQAEEAETYEQNHQQLAALQEQYMSLMQQVVQGYKDTESRFRLGELAAETGQYDKARDWFSMASRIDPSLVKQAEQKTQSFYYGLPELVSTEKFRTGAAGEGLEKSNESSPDKEKSGENDAGDSTEKPDETAVETPGNASTEAEVPKYAAKPVE